MDWTIRSFGRSFGRALLLIVPALWAGTAVFDTAVFAQWPDDPASPLVVADRAGDQEQPKVVATADGGAYVSWFDNATGGYDVYLQRLDVAGVEQWAHDGVLVADRGFSSTQDYGLAVDTAGNALLAFRDDSVSGVQVAAAKVAPDGTVLWHLQLTDTTDFVAAPKVAGTSDGDVVVAWTQEADVHVQKLDPDGASLWGPDVVLTPASGSFAASDLQASDAGTAILAFVHSGGGAGPRHLWAQKLAAADGAPLWPAAHVKVFDDASGSLQFGNFPTFLSDGAGGAVFAWYTSSPSLQVRAQRILAAGTEAFAHNGVAVSTDASHLRVSPSAAWLPASAEIVVAWTELNTLQSQHGVSAQKLASDGSRLWGASGQTVVPLGNEITQVRTLPSGDGAIVAWVETLAFGNQPIHAARLDDGGAFVWTPGIVDVATPATGTSRLAATLSTAGFAVYAWADGGFGALDVLAQSLGQDGTVGGGLIFGDGFESGDLSAWSTTAP